MTSTLQKTLRAQEHRALEACATHSTGGGFGVVERQHMCWARSRMTIVSVMVCCLYNKKNTHNCFSVNDSDDSPFWATRKTHVQKERTGGEE